MYGWTTFEWRCSQSEEFHLYFVMMDDQVNSDNLEVEMAIDDAGDSVAEECNVLERKSICAEWNKYSLENYVESTRSNMKWKSENIASCSHQLGGHHMRFESFIVT